MQSERIQVPITRLRIDRTTREVVSRAVVGYKEMSRSEYGDSLVLALTGMSTGQVCRKLLEMQAEKERAVQS